MHCDLPVISTRCRHGLSEVLGGGRWRNLVPAGDRKALAGAMRALLRAPPVSGALRTRAAQFSVQRAVDAYRRLLFSV